MKKCSYCGKEYPDDVLQCAVDDTLLDPQPEQVVANDTSAVARPVPKAFSEWHTRLIELLLVCSVAFAGSVLTSLHSIPASSPRAGASENYYWFSAIVRQTCALALLWYVLRRTGRTLYDLGFSWARTDLVWSILLRVAAFLAFEAVYFGIRAFEGAGVIPPLATINVSHFLFGDHLVVMAVLFQFVNPFYEELIVRAYVMTEVKYLTGSTGKAIFVSTALQSVYHLYQGVPNALGHAAAFLIFSIFYAKTRRITPVILAHLYMDVGFTLFYFFRHQM